MNNYKFYRNRVLSKGKTSAERLTNAHIKSFNDFMELAPNAYDVKIDGEIHRSLIQDIAFNNERLPDKHLITNIDVPIEVGFYVEWDNKSWIVRTKEEETVKSKQACQIGKCNNRISFQDEDTLEIHTIPCILEDKTSVYSDGLDIGKKIMLADDQLLITIPDNETTKKVDRYTRSRRYIFNNDRKEVYRTTRIKRTLYNGLTLMVMEHDIYDKNVDNLELNVADYVSPIEVKYPEIPEDGTVIQITGQDKISILNSGSYVSKIYNNGTEIDADVVFELNNKLAKIESQNGKICEIVANPNWKYGDVILKAKLAEDENVFSEKTISVIGL